MSEELFKQPAESRLYQFIYSNLLDTGETLSSITSVEQENLGKVSGSGALTLDTAILGTESVQVRISGGTVNESYEITTLVVTSASNILELEGLLHIRDI